ncbi:hypothetical protein PQR34_48050 [Paraburkholderia sediminicola]|uniref:hypothetical protein n=1 Tax=Paraburkholderia sediminicola TaxID=458836 RepID=UPI0038BBB70F
MNLLAILTSVLMLGCIAAVVFVSRRDPLAVPSIVRIDAVSQPRWPDYFTRAGCVCLLVSLMSLLALCLHLMD